MNKEHTRLQGKVAFITGAGHGIGKIIAKVFAQEGASVVIFEIDEQKGKNVEKEIKDLGFDAVFFKGDLCKEEDIKSAIDFTIEKFGNLDVLINNARPKLTLYSFPENLDEWDFSMNVLLKAPALTSKYALPHLSKSKGSIINISSINSFFISHQSVNYHVAKAGLDQLTRYLAYELGPKGIRVNSICPALVDLHDEDKPITSDEKYKKITELIVPLKRASQAEEIAEVAIFLCTNSSSYITGQRIIIDGGMGLGEHFCSAQKVFDKKVDEHIEPIEDNKY